MLPDPLTYSLIPEKKNPSCSSYIHSTASAWRHLHYVKQSSWRSFSYQHKSSCLWATHLQLLCKPTWWPTSTLRKRLSQELTEPGTQTLLGMTSSFSLWTKNLSTGGLIVAWFWRSITLGDVGTYLAWRLVEEIARRSLCKIHWWASWNYQYRSSNLEWHVSWRNAKVEFFQSCNGP